MNIDQFSLTYELVYDNTNKMNEKCNGLVVEC